MDKQRLNNLLLSNNMTISELEKKLSMSNGSLRKDADIRSDRLASVADFFGVSMDYLMGRDTEHSSDEDEKWIIETYRNANQDTKDMIKRLCAYAEGIRQNKSWQVIFYWWKDDCMKKLISVLFAAVILILTVGCSSDQPEKASGKILNVLPDNLRKEVAAANPDVVTIDYLGEHGDIYKTKEYYDMIIIKGKVTHFGISKFGDFEVSLDNSKYSFILHDESANLVEGDEYIFILTKFGGVIENTLLVYPPYYYSLED